MVRRADAGEPAPRAGGVGGAAPLPAGRRDPGHRLGARAVQRPAGRETPRGRVPRAGLGRVRANLPDAAAPDHNPLAAEVRRRSALRGLAVEGGLEHGHQGLEPPLLHALAQDRPPADGPPPRLLQGRLCPAGRRHGSADRSRAAEGCDSHRDARGASAEDGAAGVLLHAAEREHHHGHERRGRQPLQPPDHQDEVHHR